MRGGVILLMLLLLYAKCHTNVKGLFISSQVLHNSDYNKHGFAHFVCEGVAG